MQPRTRNLIEATSGLAFFAAFLAQAVWLSWTDSSSVTPARLVVAVLAVYGALGQICTRFPRWLRERRRTDDRT